MIFQMVRLIFKKWKQSSNQRAAKAFPQLFLKIPQTLKVERSCRKSIATSSRNWRTSTRPGFTQTVLGCGTYSQLPTRRSSHLTQSPSHLAATRCQSTSIKDSERHLEHSCQGRRNLCKRLGCSRPSLVSTSMKLRQLYTRSSDSNTTWFPPLWLR